MFINAFDEIAPAAIRAGQLAKSMATFHEDSNRNSETTLHEARTAVTTNPALSLARKRLAESASIDAAVVAAFALVRQFTPASVCAWFEYQQERDSYRCARVLGDSSNCCEA